MLRTIKQAVLSKLKGYIQYQARQAIMDAAPYIFSAPEERASFYVLDSGSAKTIRDNCNRGERLVVEDRLLDYEDFISWTRKFSSLEQHYLKSGDVCLEKLLEHYVTHREHGLGSGDVFIDVAAQESPYADILLQKGIEAYRLDISYPSGIHGRKIGANAAFTNLPEEFCNAMSAHCAFECFQGNADFLSVIEAGRILKPGGKFVIAPLYLAKEHIVRVSPFLKERVSIDEGARRVWRGDVYLEPFSRSYSPEALYGRLIEKLPSCLSAKLVHFPNIHEVSERWTVSEGQRVYLYFMLVLEKSMDKGTVQK